VKRLTIVIDEAHSLQLMRGESIAIKVPPNTPVLQLRLATLASTPDSFAKVLDVFFNGRPA